MTVFVDVIKVRILKLGGYPGFSSWGLNAVMHILEEQGRGRSDTHGGEGSITTNIEIAVMQP